MSEYERRYGKMPHLKKAELIQGVVYMPSPVTLDYGPPHAALMFAPAAELSYQHALLLWSVITIVGYALIVWSAWKVVADRLPDRTFVIAAAAAFPPFWSLILHGQVTVILLAAFWAGWLALERHRRWLAGFAFGLLAIKPQFGIPLAVVVLAIWITRPV